MKLLTAGVVVIAFAGCQSNGQQDVKLETKQDRISYSIGLNIGNNLNKDSITITPEAFLRGVLDASRDSTSRLLTEAQARAMIDTLQNDIQTRQAENARIQGEANMKEGREFLAENAKKPGVVTLPSGLQYRVITQGSGKKPNSQSTVTTHYVGKLLNGTEFDSSVKRGSPATFALNSVIAGWTEGLQLMNVGSKWELFVPSHLGYGATGAGGVIPPHATLIFEVELLDVK